MRKVPLVLIYIVAGSLLAGYIYFFERGPKKDKDAEKKPTVFQGYVADDIHEIRVENLSATKVAEKAPIVILDLSRLATVNPTIIA